MSDSVITPAAVYAFGAAATAGHMLGMPVQAVVLGALASAVVTMRSKPKSIWMVVSYTIIGGLLGGALAPPVVSVLIGEVLLNYPTLVDQSLTFTHVVAPVFIGLLWQAFLNLAMVIFPSFERRADDIVDWLLNLLPLRSRK